ncbi:MULTISPECIES: MBL fold metallo-hydrolase [unclassified Leeuwenhoekiella]|uniref:MBL fold metallo-hydrolase n=1 Tax=unclassified Leeuwenhoekiella TaxID=2615029 RepID=UPI000C460340|nr:MULTISPECIES: MBL fold metallo-hydrolase [unclassified Leeuwenhoekiella]MBA81970.1 MBL fold metallo-hydrolase [Leeuwenhoekiella sp.]|tara:strand:- start:4422 stop:5762 length:1341 start_codon:yes stop_codon:yes gene_type:complete
MLIKQFEYKPLSHFSYAILSEGLVALVDPERDPAQYYAFAEEHNAKIVAVFETHPHADFISSHLQIHKETGATIYNSEKTGAGYTHQHFDEGDHFKMGSIDFTALNTPGHSPDSITIVAKTDDETALFTGDTLFIGDVGRPDLRENAGNQKAKRRDLAKAMFQTMTTKFEDLPGDAMVYPAHGAGSLCGKGMSADKTSSSLKEQRETNWAFKVDEEEAFINHLLDSQPFIPHYFGYNVDLNKTGAPTLRNAIADIPFNLFQAEVNGDALVIDTRDEAVYKKGHKRNSINIMAAKEAHKFETWLGSIVQPEEEFSLVTEGAAAAHEILNRIAKIGYETQVKRVITLQESAGVTSPKLDLEAFKANPEAFTVVDIRNRSETENGKFFEHAITIPLHELRERSSEIPTDKPIVVHCAGGYRSAAGSSVLETTLSQATVYDLGDAVKDFQ